MASRKVYRFTLILKGVTDITDELENAVLDAGCDDALLWSRDGVAGLDFDRERVSEWRAIGSAVDALRSAGYAVARVEFDEPVLAG